MCQWFNSTSGHYRRRSGNTMVSKAVQRGSIPRLPANGFLAKLDCTRFLPEFNESSNLSGPTNMLRFHGNGHDDDERRCGCALVMHPYSHEKSYRSSCKCYYCKSSRQLNRQVNRRRYKTDPLRRALKKAARQQGRREISQALLEMIQ